MTSISSCSARAPAATRRRSEPPSSASRSPSSTRTRSAGRVSIAAASRPRPCSSPRRSRRRSATPRITAWSCRATPTVDYAAMAARRDAVVKRLWTGLKTLIDKNKVTWVAGRGRLDGPRQGQGQPDGRGRHAGCRRRSHPERDRRHHRHRIARQVAAGPDARREAHRDQRRRAPDGHPAEGHRHRRGGRGRASNSPACSPTSESR